MCGARSRPGRPGCRGSPSLPDLLPGTASGARGDHHIPTASGRPTRPHGGRPSQSDIHHGVARERRPTPQSGPEAHLARQAHGCALARRQSRAGRASRAQRGKRVWSPGDGRCRGRWVGGPRRSTAAGMTLLIGQGDGPSFPYAGRPIHILAGHGDRPAGFAAAELAVPATLRRPIPDAYGKFDEAIYVLNGGLTVLGEQGPRGVGTGASAFAPTSMWCSSGRCRPS